MNGHKVNVERAYYTMRAVELHPNASYVKFSFEPVSFYIGLIISTLTLVITILLLINRFKLRVQT